MMVRAAPPAFATDAERRAYALACLQAAERFRAYLGVELAQAMAALAPSRVSIEELEEAARLMRGKPDDAGSREYPDALQRRANAGG